jgi:hypothetical protein
VSVPFWVVELAGLFWAEAGMIEPFPRNLRRPIARGLMIAVVSLPQLRIADVRRWLCRNGIACPCAESDRRLRACLVARSGWGFVFIDGTDPEDEQRLSLAHELAHFLRHYWHPRQQAVKRLGSQVLEVFDGNRSPTLGESFHALLADIPLGFHLHLMQRDAGGTFADAKVAAAEWEADRLAYELLAPADAVLTQASAVRGEPDRLTVAAVLQGCFGLPATHAAVYSDILIPEVPQDPLLKRLGLVR